LALNAPSQGQSNPFGPMRVQPFGLSVYRKASSEIGLYAGSGTVASGWPVRHHGILFLDELPEFNREALEVLGQPLEDGQLTISRAAASLT
jgi:predicted ATPase with chaperone activity